MNTFAADKKDNNMAQVAMTVRMDAQLKKNFDLLCSQFGMSANTAMNIFVNAVVTYGKIPFEIKARTTNANSMGGLDAFREIREMAENGLLPDMTLEEINEEICSARKERKQGV